MLLCDLHLHTTKSDGVFEPSRLFDDVRKRELAAFSVTDHDCMEAYPVPHDLLERCIPGIEIDCELNGHTVHLLAYGIEDTNCPLLRTLASQRERRLGRMQAMLGRLRALNIDVSMDEVRSEAKNASSIGRPHLARVLVSKKHVATVQEAFDRYLCEEQGGFVPLSRLHCTDIMRLAREAGGVLVAAHPMRLHDIADLEKLCEAGLDGVEVIHPTASASDEAMLVEFARARGLLITGGTDFHAPAGREIGVELPSEAIDRLRKAIAARKHPAVGVD
jgi:predicted metal-dependent phosphoesterase TrpH